MSKHLSNFSLEFALKNEKYFYNGVDYTITIVGSAWYLLKYALLGDD